MRSLIARKMQAGVTLVEMIVAIVITGILLSLTSMFVRNQVDSYTDVARRTDLVDTANTAVRRMARDLATALPNSPRVPQSNCVEYIPTKAGGRYRSESDGGADPLNLTAADTSFNMYGPQSANASQQIAINDLIAVYNLGITGADAFAGDNTAAVAAPAPAWDVALQETKITITSKLFPLASPTNRFQVIPASEQAVSYVCLGAGTSGSGDGQGTLYRYVRTLPYPASSPPACPASVPAGTPVLASNVSACTFTYTPGSLQRTGLVSIALEIRRANEPVILYQNVNVVNTP
ncbi:MAG TPA: prepilin-type N-terminal cleavage/methylation domain-containing protein [Accumulibacter sp.]|nr:prepilin-type N-terminal cleavage/methylation domain-containing protein [Accumulibacter sp.]